MPEYELPNDYEHLKNAEARAAEAVDEARAELEDAVEQIHPLTGVEIYAKMQAAMAVPKNKQATGGARYNYRDLDDINKALKPLVLKYKSPVLCTDRLVSEHVVHVQEWDNRAKQMLEKDVLIATIESTATLYTPDGMKFSASATSDTDLGKTNMCGAQKRGAASTYGHKYAIGGLFAISAEIDPDAMEQSSPAPQDVQATVQAVEPVQQVMSLDKSMSPEAGKRFWEARLAHKGIDPHHFGCKCTHCGWEYRGANNAGLNDPARMLNAKCQQCGSTDFDVIPA